MTAIMRQIAEMEHKEKAATAGPRSTHLVGHKKREKELAFKTRTLGEEIFSVSITTQQGQAELGPRIQKQKGGREGSNEKLYFKHSVPNSNKRPRLALLQSAFLCYNLHRSSLLVRTRQRVA
jgi:hypothetical protein